MTISRQLGHADPGITLKTYAHQFMKRDGNGLGAKMEALVKAETPRATVSTQPGTM